MNDKERFEQIKNDYYECDLDCKDIEWLIERVEQLQQEKESAVEGFKQQVELADECIKENTELRKQLQQAQAKAEKYKEVLEWYAHPETYKRAGNGEYVIMMDKGWNAQQALKEGES